MFQIPETLVSQSPNSVTVSRPFEITTRQNTAMELFDKSGILKQCVGIAQL